MIPKLWSYRKTQPATTFLCAKLMITPCGLGKTSNVKWLGLIIGVNCGKGQSIPLLPLWPDTIYNLSMESLKLYLQSYKISQVGESQRFFKDFKKPLFIMCILCAELNVTFRARRPALSSRCGLPIAEFYSLRSVHTTQECSMQRYFYGTFAPHGAHYIGQT